MLAMTERDHSPFYWPGSKAAVLLIHGFTGSPAEMRPLGEYLRAQGYAVYAPLLAGHGAGVVRLSKTGAKDWRKSAEDVYLEMVHRERGKPIFVIGLSMGAMIGLDLARTYPMDALVLLAPAVFVKRRFASLSHALKYLVPFLRMGGEDESVAVGAVSSLLTYIKAVRLRVNEVHVPVLIMQGLLDQTIWPKGASYLYRHIGSAIRRLEWLVHSPHVVTYGAEKEIIFQMSSDFLAEFLHNKERRD